VAGLSQFEIASHQIVPLEELPHQVLAKMMLDDMTMNPTFDSVSTVALVSVGQPDEWHSDFYNTFRHIAFDFAAWPFKHS